MQILFNGEQEELQESQSVLGFLQGLEMNPDIVRIDLNGKLLAKEELSTTVLQEGDRIEIDIPAKKLNLLISEDEMKKRLARWQPMKRELKGYLKRYAQLVRSAHTGATFE